MTGTEMLRIAELDTMEVLVEVNENDIVKLMLGDTAYIELDAFLGEKLEGVLVRLPIVLTLLLVLLRIR